MSVLQPPRVMDPYKNSIVHEYRVLYSTRIIQKDKKWSDGILRFYELNNKVEIAHPTQLLLVSDFLSGSTDFILNEVLAIGHEFRLPNRQFVLMVDEKIGVSVRDVSRLVRTRESVVAREGAATVVGKRLKREAKDEDGMKSEQRTGDGGATGIKGNDLKAEGILGETRVKLEHDLEMGPHIKQEPTEGLDLIKLSSSSHTPAYSKRLSNRPIVPIAGRRIGMSRPSQIHNPTKPIKKEPTVPQTSASLPRTHVRIPPRSSRVFQYLQTYSKSG